MDGSRSCVPATVRGPPPLLRHVSTPLADGQPNCGGTKRGGLGVVERNGTGRSIPGIPGMRVQIPSPGPLLRVRWVLTCPQGHS